MNARVFLLVMVTATFMAVWDADRPVAAPGAVGRVRSHQAAVSESQTTPGFIPVPTDLQSGTWQVFNHDGATFRITIEGLSDDSTAAPTELNNQATVEKQLWVTTGGEGIRWCFVKEQVQATVHQAAAKQRKNPIETAASDH